MFRKISVTMTLCASLIAVRAAMIQEPLSILLDNVRTLSNKVVNYDGDKHISAAFADEVFANAKRASMAVDKVIARGAPASQTVTLNTGNQEKPMALTEIKAMCERIAKVAALSNAAQALDNTAYWPGWIADGTINQPAQAENALRTSKFCIAKVDEALANGVPDSTVVQAADRKMSLAEGREICVYVRDTAEKIFAKQTAEEEAQYEPFRKLLSGDKLSLYNDRLKKYKLYGAGGRVLRTPEDHRDSALWCTAGVNREGIVPIWSVDCWHFREMTRVGTVTSRSGEGDEPPSSAFR